ncbi:MAG: hypothetical protein LBF72_03905 [Holosporales bacterium]|nr:hypothetical protein [Holosporales bacterium]
MGAKLKKRFVKTVDVLNYHSIYWTSIAKNNPDLPCDALFDEQEWEALFCTANRTKAPPRQTVLYILISPDSQEFFLGESRSTSRKILVFMFEMYISDAVKFLSWLGGGPQQPPSDEPPGVKLVWSGLSNLQLLITYREWL